MSNTGSPTSSTPSRPATTSTDLPKADLLAAGVSYVNYPANTKKAYAQALSLFDVQDPDFEARVTRSERDRATANCVLHYADAHHPRVMILVECTTELQSWGRALPGRPKVGDGSTYRWWLRQFSNLGYRHRTLYLNSMFFGVGQSTTHWSTLRAAPTMLGLDSLAIDT